MSTSTLHETSGPSIALREDDRELAEDIVDILESIPTIDREEIVERHGRTSFTDEQDVHPNYLHKYRPREHDLPGFGRRYDGTEGQIPCGATMPHVCREHGHDHDVGRTCSRSECPRCGAAWVVKRAIGIVAKIQSAAKMKDGAQYKHHAAVSPPREWFIDADDKWGAALEAMGEFMDRIDFDGICIPHPYSGAPDGGRQKGSFSNQHNDDRGAWKERIFSGRDFEGDVRDELEARPHFHLIGASPWFPMGDVTTEVYEETGWVIHRILNERDKRAVSLENIHDLARAVTYALSHCAIDTTGERNQYLFKKKGWAYHETSNRDPSDAHAANLRDAEEAVHNVAPKTLGLPSFRIECHEDVQKDQQQKEYEASLLEDSSSVDDVGSVASSDEPSTRRCRSDLVHIAKADFVTDPEWQANAPHGDRAAAIRAAWDEAGGWAGLRESGQGALTGDILEDDPPPD